MMFGIIRKPDPGVIAAGGKPRSPKWESWLKKFLVGKSCVVCGATGKLTGHHVIPFHLDPSRELDASNVEPVCVEVCHLLIGHLKDWRLMNLDFRRDAAALLAKRKSAMEKLNA